ncbi:nucleolin-like isoform X2 [Dendropsophus ebraccatus]|uniref:nucleolin-like isoform X2 n=1 Tax=Dendropsophus ebraccatus TaxID=150705 RepID=UPI0038317AFE
MEEELNIIYSEEDQFVEDTDFPVVYEEHAGLDDGEDEESDFGSDIDDIAEDSDDWDSDDIDERLEDLEWKMAVMDAPWIFRDDKYPLYSWIPSLETIVETDEEEEEDEAADIPWSEDDTEEDTEDWDSDDIDERLEHLEWKMAVMDAPWIFRDDKYPLYSWIPSLETIVETDEEEEADEAADFSSEIDDDEEDGAAADIPSEIDVDEEEDVADDIPREEEEDEEDKGTAMEIPRSSSRRRSILSRLRALFCCCCATKEE